MSASYDGAVGDWKSEENLLNDPYHHDFMAKVITMDPINQNRAYQAKAIENIKNHPKAYIKNWASNISRMLFELPYTNNDIGLAPLKSILPHMLLLPLLLLSFILHLLKLKSTPPVLSFLALFFLIYFAGSSLVSAMGRMFFITVPFLIVYVAYFTRTLHFYKKSKSLELHF
jgi:hypothetical protein